MSQGMLSVLNPTSFSPDGKLFYLHFDDTEYKITDYDALNLVATEILNALKNPNISIDFSYRELALLEQDYCIVCSILYGASQLPEDFMYPEFYLREAKDAK
jgi:WD40 repeat protein